MTDDNYGHKGPMVTEEMTLKEETRRLIGCEHCGCYAPRDSPEELREMDCNEYAELQNAL